MEVILNNEEMNVSNDNAANGTTVNSGGIMYISSGSTVDGMTVNSGGIMYIFSGGIANNTTLNGGYLAISGGETTSSLINGGTEDVFNNGGTYDAVINSGGRILLAGGKAISTIVSSGGSLMVRAYSGALSYASDAQILSGGFMDVYDSSTAENTVIGQGGYVRVRDYGSAVSTLIQSGALMYVYSGGVAEIARISGGTVCISGGTLCSTTVSSGGVVELYSGGTISGMTLSSGAKAFLRPGATVTGINAASGAILGFDVAPDTYFQGSYAGKAFEQKSGVLSNYDIHSGCHVSVCSGGTFSEGSVLSGGTLCLLSGASAADAVVNGGFMDVFSSGIAENTVICSGGYVRVRDFGSAIGTLIESGASMYVHSSNGYAYDTLISGFGRVYDGATMSKVTIASGGNFHLWRGGILKDAEIQYGGLLDIRESAPILEGDILVNGQLKASYNQNINSKNANIVIDLTNRTEADDYSIINLDYLSDANFSISVSADQGTGIYKLASGAANWDSSFSLSVNNSNSVDISFGNVISVSGKNYTISKGTDNALVLSIADSANLPDDKFKSFSAYTEQGPYSFGLGKISEFTFDDATIKAGFICCISGMQSKDWIMLEDQTFTLGEFFHPKIYDAEKIDVISVDDYWCGQLTEINMLNWINTLNRAGYQSGDDFATELALLGNTVVSPSNYIVEQYGIPWGNWAKKIGDIEEKNMFNKLQNVEILLRNGCVSWLQIYHGTPENITGGHATTLLGFTFDTSYAPDDPRYYSGVIIADSDDTKRSYDDISSPPERIRIVRLLWDEDMQNYWFEGKDRHFIENIWTFQNNSVPETADLTWYQTNSWTTQMTVSPVLDADKDTPVLWSDEKIYLNFAIINQGLAESGKFYVSLYVDDKLLEIFKVDSMEAADISAIQNYEIGKLSAGSHTIKAVIDSENNVAEAFETNNIYSKTIEVTQAGEKAYFGAAEGFVISTGVAVKDIVLSSGGRIHLRGEKALLENASVVTKAQLFVSSGGGLKDCEITASCYIYFGASAQNTTINSSGYLSVSNGRTKGTVNNGGTEDVFFGAVTESATVCSGGRILLAGGSALDAVISSGGRLHVRSYASAASYASNTVVCSGGYMEVYDYSTAEKTVVHSGGSMYVFTSGAYAYDTLISGFGRVYDGATMSKVTIASGGSFHLWRGGILKDAEIQYGGLLDIRESSSILTGDVLVAGQLDISFDHKTDFSDADIVVDMSGRTASDTYSIVNLSYIGETTISIKVADNQARGTYKFASNASLFTDTITIGNGTKSFGTLTIGGAALEYGDYSYSLVQSGKNLDFVVTASKIPAPTVTADVTTPTNKEVTLTAVFDEFSTVREYRIDGGNWQNCTGTVKVSQNSTVEFRCQDAQGVYSDTAVYTVSNIDKTAPVITLTGNTELPARKVLITAASDDGSTLMYSTDNAGWNTYTAPVAVTENGTLYFKSTDAAGNTGFASLVITNIDLTAPDAPIVTADVTGPTNGKVTLSAVFTPGAAQKQYSFDNRNWNTYTSDVVCSDNRTVYFREIDAAGNISDVSSYTVANIDKAAPDVPAGMTAAAEKGVVSLDWSDASDTGIAGMAGYNVRYGKNISLTGEGTFVADSAFEVTGLADGKWYFQVQTVDKAGNVSAWSTKVSVDVDFTAPVITLTANTERPAASILLTAKTDDGSDLFYSTDQKTWTEYNDHLVVTENGTLYFKSTDDAGNTSEKSITFTNIDKTLPDTLFVTADITAPTRSNVTVTPVYTGNAVSREYSLNQGSAWRSYTSPISVRANTVLYFRETDTLGNKTIVTYAVTNIDKSAPDAVAECTLTQTFTGVTFDWSDAADNGTAGIAGYNFRYGKGAVLSGTGTFVESSSAEIAGLENGVWYFQIQSVDKAGNTSSWSKSFSVTVAHAVIENLSGSASGLLWQDSAGVTPYVVEYSKDGFETTLSVTAPTVAVDTCGMPEGTYACRVNGIEGNSFTAAASDEAQKLVSDADGHLDLFFGQAQGLWEENYAAQHLGNGAWEGTKEQVLLAGKNKIADIFNGSDDANILVLTDDANGDALFVDDIYTALGDQARFSQIDEIRAGAGDDIVDMTSQRYAYTGSEITIYGGSGNDTIWGGAESNTLFGDAGNDRLVGGSGDDVIVGGSGSDSMHGGGGNDIFTFGADWGNDTVEQLSSGSVTLWFESGSEDNWNSETLTYSDGVNTVTVTGCTNVTLRFGADGSLPAGAFLDAASKKVFEDKNKGFIA